MTCSPQVLFFEEQTGYQKSTTRENAPCCSNQTAYRRIFRFHMSPDGEASSARPGRSVPAPTSIAQKIILSTCILAVVIHGSFSIRIMYYITHYRQYMKPTTTIFVKIRLLRFRKPLCGTLLALYIGWKGYSQPSNTCEKEGRE